MVFIETCLFVQRKPYVVIISIIITGDVEIHTDALLRTWHGPNGKIRVLCE